MPPARKALAVALAIASTLYSVPLGVAGPVLIRDSLISDPAITPSLGRGYSIATNSFQSTCLKPITKTTPSYNLIYSFEELDASGSSKTDISVAAPGGASVSTPSIKVKINAPVDATIKLENKVTRQYMKVSIDVETYYATIDEEQSPLSPIALQLITANDLPGFFDACGVYYTRSINRRSTYLSIFSYETASATRDFEFEAQLKNEITGFGNSVMDKKAPPQTPPGSKKITSSVAPTSPTPPPSSTSSTAPPPSAPSDAPPMLSIEQKVTSKKTTIRSYAFGMGKQIMAEGSTESLVAYDLETFKSAMKFAFKMMQNDNVGIVTAIEVVPWIENLQFQSAYKLPTSGEMDDPNAPVPTGGANPAPAAKIKVSPYAQKRIMSQNSEFLSEIDRSSRNRLVTLYKAKLCKIEVEKSYGKSGAPGAPVTLGEYGNKNIMNNRTQLPSEDMPLNKFYSEQLAPDKIDALANDYQDFTYKRAQVCIDALLSAGFTIGIYRNIVACAGLEKEFTVASSRLIDDYCRVSFAPTAATPSAAGGAAAPAPATK